MSVPTYLGELAEMIMINVHETWSAEHIKSGWRYHPKRDNQALLHNCLLPYGALTEKDKEYDRTTSLAAITLILALGYKINQREDEPEDVLANRRKAIELMMVDATVSDFMKSEVARSGGDGSVKRADDADGESKDTDSPSGSVDTNEQTPEFITYSPRPLDTSSIDIQAEVTDLVEFMSKNAHENWAKQKIADGYKHASNEKIRETKLKFERLRMRNPNDRTIEEPLLSSMLALHEDPKEEDKEKNRTTVRATIKTILYLGFSFEAPIHTIDFASLATHTGTAVNKVPAHHHQVIEDPNDTKSGSQGVHNDNFDNDTIQLDTAADAVLFKKQQLNLRKTQLLDMYLMAAARNNNPEIIDMLVRADEGSILSAISLTSNLKQLFKHFSPSSVFLSSLPPPPHSLHGLLTVVPALMHETNLDIIHYMWLQREAIRNWVETLLEIIRCKPRNSRSKRFHYIMHPRCIFR